DYERARAEAPPEVVVAGHGRVRAATLGAAAAAAGMALPAGRDPEDPLVAGDEVDLTPRGPETTTEGRAARPGPPRSGGEIG
ncbi:MAG TPA: hypothetical protein VHB30_04855, partial [Solirubrobacteraceae bacterium]|nr:hypothetical protein [Solirubrobacteraceae bacterium]